MNDNVKPESDCACRSISSVLNIESIPFKDIPGQSRLFTEYQDKPLELTRYYPLAVESHTRISERIPEILENYRVDRKALCDVLEETNRTSGASEKTLENIQLLRQDDCVAVVSGQQAGLFTGPLYTIYKALSAVRMADCLNARGFKAVPVFWVAAEDHDFQEVSMIEVIDSNGELAGITNEPKGQYQDVPVGYIKLDDSITQTIADLFKKLPRTEFSEELRAVFENTWRTGVDYGEAFARLLTNLLAKFGLITLCPLDVRLKQLAGPVYVEAIKKSAEIVSSLRKRSEKLLDAGYHAQVLVPEDYFPLFWQANDKTRNALKKSGNGNFRARDIDLEFTLSELADMAAVEPQRFSPSVVLRSVVQDYLLPTICYFGGAAEIAYFAQSAEVYRILERPVTPILHRQSFTFVDPGNSKTLQKYDLHLRDLFAGAESLLPSIVENYLNPEMAAVFARSEDSINKELDRLERHLRDVEPTLADSLAKRRRKIIYQLTNVNTKFHRAQINKDTVLQRQISRAISSLAPHSAPQERVLNIAWLLNRYGGHLVDWIYQAIDLDDKNHRVIFL